MPQEFDADRRLYVDALPDGHSRVVRPAERDRPTDAQHPQAAAAEFLRENAAAVGVQPEWLDRGAPGEAGLTEAEPAGDIGLRFSGEKSQFDSTTVGYEQTWRGLPVWRSGVSVTMRTEPTRVATVSNTSFPEITVAPPAGGAVERTAVGDDGLLNRAFDVPFAVGDIERRSRSRVARAERPRTEIVTDRTVVYRYDAARRLTDERPAPEAGAVDPQNHLAVPFPFPVPAAPDIEDGSFRVAREIVFRVLTPPREEAVTWLAIVDADTSALLYLRPFIADVTGLVFRRDPLSAGGTAGPDAPSATLDTFRGSVVLPGLSVPPPGGQLSLSGDRVEIRDFEPPTSAPPQQAVGAPFDYVSRTNDFAAVNAYYHNDGFFRLAEELGFTAANFFGGTSFPVPVDHRGRFGTTNGIEINASCSGDGVGGIANVDYELANLTDTSNPIGLAVDRRIVLHELGGHGILYNHVNSANFGFSHSAGDSFACVLSDPDSLAPDRFLTFPWVGSVIDRRHDRPVGGGWAWGGVKDVGGYLSEQILSTSHFRIYRSLGGDSSSPATRRFAARVTAYLMLRAVGTLTPATNPSNAMGWVNALLSADAGDWTTAGLAGGAYGKVIRWAFEKQGLYQAPGAPTPVKREGRPPAQDVYIDDGRSGEYQFQPVHWNNQSVWNRRFADGGTAHEDPWLNRTNFAYVRVRNRGFEVATDVVVRAFHTDPGAGLTWPDDWLAMTTAQLAAPDVPPGGEVIVGPFSWTPTTPDHECLLMVASSAGDPSNVDALSPGESIAEWRLVPHDNNIGQRNVHPVPAAGGAAVIVEALNGRSLTVRNPFDERAKVVVDIIVPKVLASRGWTIDVASRGGTAFSLAPGAAKRVTLSVTRGDEVTASDVAGEAERDVVVRASGNGILLGGMTYRLDPSRVEAPRPDEGSGVVDGPVDGWRDAAQNLLQSLRLPADRAVGVRLRKVGLDIEIDEG